MSEILGHMYQDDTATNIAVAATDTDYIVTGMSCNIKRGMVFQNGKEFKIVTPGIYRVSWQTSFTSENANQDIEGAIGIGGTRVASTSSHRKIATGTDTGNMSGQGILILAVDNLVQLVVRNETSTGDIIIQHTQLTISLETEKVG